jgi:hypothetical protein
MEVNLHNSHDSCYADSFLIFILVYHRIPFFLDNFYESAKNDIKIKQDGLPAEFFNRIFIARNLQQTEAYYIAELRQLLGNMQTHLAQKTRTCTDYRDKFRDILQAIWYRNKDKLQPRITNLQDTDTWNKTDLESSDLLQYLLYLFNVPPHNIYLLPESGFRYDTNELGKKIPLSQDELARMSTPNIQIPGLIYNVFATETDEIVPAIQTRDSLDYMKFIMPSTEAQNTLIYPNDNNLHLLFLTTILPNELKRTDITQDTTSTLPADIKDKYAGLINHDIVKFNKWVYDETSKAFINYIARDDLPIIFINVNRIIRHHNGTKELSPHPVDLTEYITNPVTGTKYILIGGTIHLGGHTGGHYTAYIRNPANNDFYYYNDIGSTVGRIGDYNQLLHANPDISKYGTTLIYIKEADYQIQHNASSASYDSNNNSGPPPRQIIQQQMELPRGKKKRQTRRRMRKRTIQQEQAELTRQRQEQAELARQRQYASRPDPAKINFIALD